MVVWAGRFAQTPKPKPLAQTLKSHVKRQNLALLDKAKPVRYIRAMQTYDIIIVELMEALELIRREALKDDCSRHYIQGVVEGATKRCNADRMRNSDGYLVVKGVA